MLWLLPWCSHVCQVYFHHLTFIIHILHIYVSHKYTYQAGNFKCVPWCSHVNLLWTYTGTIKNLLSNAATFMKGGIYYHPAQCTLRSTGFILDYWSATFLRLDSCQDLYFTPPRDFQSYPIQSNPLIAYTSSRPDGKDRRRWGWDLQADLQPSGVCISSFSLAHTFLLLESYDNFNIPNQRDIIWMNFHCTFQRFLINFHFIWERLLKTFILTFKGFYGLSLSLSETFMIFYSLRLSWTPQTLRQVWERVDWPAI